MRRIVVLLVFAVVVGGALWWSLFPTEESQRPRQMTPASTENSDPAPEIARERPGAPAPRSVTPGAREEALASREAVNPAELESNDEPPKPTRSSASRERLLVETKVAAAAASRGLLTPLELESRVARAVPEGSVPADQLVQEQADARRRILARTAIADYLARKKLGPNPSPFELRRISGLGYTILSAESAEVEAKLMDEVAASLGEDGSLAE